MQIRQELNKHEYRFMTPSHSCLTFQDYFNDFVCSSKCAFIFVPIFISWWSAFCFLILFYLQYAEHLPTPLVRAIAAPPLTIFTGRTTSPDPRHWYSTARAIPPETAWTTSSFAEKCSITTVGEDFRACALRCGKPITRDITDPVPIAADLYTLTETDITSFQLYIRDSTRLTEHTGCSVLLTSTSGYSVVGVTRVS